jgi:hypothetical protein
MRNKHCGNIIICFYPPAAQPSLSIFFAYTTNYWMRLLINFYHALHDNKFISAAAQRVYKKEAWVRSAAYIFFFQINAKKYDLL